MCMCFKVVKLLRGSSIKYALAAENLGNSGVRKSPSLAAYRPPAQYAVRSVNFIDLLRLKARAKSNRA